MLSNVSRAQLKKVSKIYETNKITMMYPELYDTLWRNNYLFNRLNLPISYELSSFPVFLNTNDSLFFNERFKRFNNWRFGYEFRILGKSEGKNEKNLYSAPYVLRQYIKFGYQRYLIQNKFPSDLIYTINNQSYTFSNSLINNTILNKSYSVIYGLNFDLLDGFMSFGTGLKASMVNENLYKTNVQIRDTLTSLKFTKPIELINENKSLKNRSLILAGEFEAKIGLNYLNIGFRFTKELSLSNNKRQIIYNHLNNDFHSDNKLKLTAVNFFLEFHIHKRFNKYIKNIKSKPSTKENITPSIVLKKSPICFYYTVPGSQSAAGSAGMGTRFAAGLPVYLRRL